MQLPLLSCPLKQTTDIDWIHPLKHYIRSHYSDDPNKYSEECATLNNLRQDIRGIENDTGTARDLLYRYYGQLELLDLRFPVDESHIKVLFNWHDAFTDKATSQYSLAFEKASTIFNIAAILSRHAADQTRHDPAALKTAYNDFQASAGMFTYINENFLHAPSTDLSRETVKTLTSLMLAQGQEVFLDKTIADGKSDKMHGLLAKLAGQAAFLYAQAHDGMQEHIQETGFDRIWLHLLQFKKHYFSALANFYQATADEKASKYGIAIGRLGVAQTQFKDALKCANSFPSSFPADLKLPSDAASTIVTAAKQQQQKCTDRLAQLNKDNDFIYHNDIASEAELEQVAKMAVAKPTPIAEIYQSPEVQRAIGPDIFQSIVPMSVTESASLYDEEKAKLVRAETERVEQANDELAAALDYMKLPGSLNILKGGSDQDTRIDQDFYVWCREMNGHELIGQETAQLSTERSQLTQRLDEKSHSLTMEESVCEKMRSKYGAQWTQQPSTRLTTTLRSDIKSYKEALSQAASSDAQLLSSYKQAASTMEEMRAASEADSIEALFQRGMSSAGAGRSGSMQGSLLDDVGDQDESESVASRIESIEDMLRKLQLIKRERQQVLKDLKEKIQSDDISNILILNKKATSSQDNQIFKAELDKFRPYQSRLLQATHKQHSLVKLLTQTYGDLLADKRVKTEQDKYESYRRSRSAVMSKYSKAYQTLKDLQKGLERAQRFYSEMKETINSLCENVDNFLSNRKAEGGQLLKTIESARALDAAIQSREDGNRLADVMSRMNVGSPSPVGTGAVIGGGSNTTYPGSASPGQMYQGNSATGQVYQANQAAGQMYQANQSTNQIYPSPSPGMQYGSSPGPGQIPGYGYGYGSSPGGMPAGQYSHGSQGMSSQWSAMSPTPTPMPTPGPMSPLHQQQPQSQQHYQQSNPISSPHTQGYQGNTQPGQGNPKSPAQGDPWASLGAWK